MNSLSSNLITRLLHEWPAFRDAVNSIANDENVKTFQIDGLQGCMYAYFTAEYCRSAHIKSLQSFQYNTTKGKSQGYTIQSFSSSASDVLVVVSGERDASDFASDIATVFPEAECYVLPWWGIVPYRPVAKGSAVFGQRAGVLSKLASHHSETPVNVKPRIFIVTQRVFQSPVPPPEYIRSLSFMLRNGQQLNTVKVADNLIKLGYTRVSRVSVRGEFSLRGEVLDIFLPCDELATRILFDFDCIENIKIFDPETQSTTAVKESILVYPMKEVVWNETLRKNLSNSFAEYEKTALSVSSGEDNSSDGSAHLAFTEQAEAAKEKLLSELEISGESEGEELFYPLLWEKKYSILDYLKDDTTVFYIDYDRLINAEESLSREYKGMYRKTRMEFPVMPPDDMYFTFSQEIKNYRRCIQFHTLSKFDTDSCNEKNRIIEKNSEIMHIPCETAQSFFGNINYLKEELSKKQQDQWHIVIYADNPNQAVRIREILKNYTEPEDKSLFPVQVSDEAVSQGFSVPDVKLLIIQENEIFGRRKYIPSSLHRVKSKAIDTFVELNPGDFVVHVNYGIGIFRGIERVKAMGNERDYIKLEYADQEFAFVPIEQVNLVQRYIGNEGEKPKIDRIGSKSWENRKNHVKQAVEDIAKKLIDLYSRRKASRGFPFPKDTEWQTAFEAAFPYEDTPDQITVTEEVKRDMEKPVPMDRLICGDVGYGKTEIAMRAAFKAVMGGKQVAFLAPTTILAEQHYETCIERFRNFPVRIAQLSRFISPAEQKKTITKLASGEIDILIGTHRIIQKDIIFKNLGLMIIDEEQRFGVKDKEKLKEMKNNIDCLAMSATPIPRTLHMSLLKIRDMSLLTTPPQNRQAIETEIEPYNEDRVAAAIRREVERGGQVFYLHNRVETLLETQRKLENLVPEMLIDVAHGQMTSEQLDDIFRRFKMGGFHVLVATTIIENGIDIPNVNTIIIDRADMYGVSQLYQLRGRVGRSDRKAYAYLLYPQNTSLSEVAMKRLQVISDFTELGSGFKIAMKDMEIRGAGNLLGRDQSGDVYAVGFDLYLRLLNEAVERLISQSDYEAQDEVLMELEYTGFIPDTYVQNTQTKMEIYKKIASVQTREELEGVFAEMTDRFGPVPDEAASLLSLAEIRILCRKLKISSLKEKQGIVQVEFGKVSDISIDKVLRLIKENSGSINLDSSRPNMLFMKIGAIGLKEKSEFIREKLEKLA